MPRSTAQELLPFLTPLSLDGPVAPFLVLADWLQERGDRWGNLIAIDAQLEARGKDAALEAERQQLLAEHGSSICPIHGQESVRLEYRRGFIARARFGYTSNATVLQERLRGLLGAPASTLLQEIDLSSNTLSDLYLKPLIEQKTRLASVHVDLRDNYFSAAGVSELRAALPKLDLASQARTDHFAESGSEHRAFIRLHGGARSIDDIDD